MKCSTKGLYFSSNVIPCMATEDHCEDLRNRSLSELIKELSKLEVRSYADDTISNDRKESISREIDRREFMYLGHKEAFFQRLRLIENRYRENQSATE